jgi:N utilization substance protein A
LRREVPEVSSGAVTIKKIVREPGNRAKIAVYSEQSGIDPVGSCVGQKGVRIQAVIDALDGLEKIDVIQWNPDPVKLITNALSPAKNLVVEADEKGKNAKVRAPREELPLIIGREGQNVRLASKLTEYNIEVEGDDSLALAPEAAPQEEKATKTVKTEGADQSLDQKKEPEVQPKAVATDSETPEEVLEENVEPKAEGSEQSSDTSSTEASESPEEDQTATENKEQTPEAADSKSDKNE